MAPETQVDNFQGVWANSKHDKYVKANHQHSKTLTKGHRLECLTPPKKDDHSRKPLLQTHSLPHSTLPGDNFQWQIKRFSHFQPSTAHRTPTGNTRQAATIRRSDSSPSGMHTDCQKAHTALPAGLRGSRGLVARSGAAWLLRAGAAARGAVGAAAALPALARGWGAGRRASTPRRRASPGPPIASLSSSPSGT